MTWKQRQEALFAAPVTFLDRVELRGPVTIRNLGGLLGLEVIVPGRAVAIAGGSLQKATHLDDDHTDTVVGVSLGGGYVATMGEVSIPTVWSAFDTGRSLWLGDDGEITHVIPSEGFQLRMGLATGPSSMMITIGEPVVLA